jgi:hypothetical protein
MTAADALAGALRLRPGQPPPNITSSRPALAATIARGQPASTLPELLGRVFALCGGAHRITAQAAITAAGGAMPGDGEADLELRLDTLREQVRRIWLDWPPLLAGGAASDADLAVLRDCPLQCRVGRPEAILAATPAWVEEQALGGPAADWLARWDADPTGGLDAWCGTATTLPARLLGGCRAAARQLATAAPRPLRVHADPAELAAIAAALRADPAFAQRPQWQGVAWETGPWTRLADPAPQRYANAWLRLGARLAEVARLASNEAPVRAGTLRRGALPLGPREGLAWCEMARGLLIHRVELDRAAEPRIARCDVLAPTEWNFHPSGPVARAIAPLAAGDDAAVRLVAAAFDPCVAIRIGPGDA